MSQQGFNVARCPYCMALDVRRSRFRWIDLPVVLLGGLADSTAPLLSPDIRALLQAARGSALDGGHILAQQLISSSSSAG